MDPGMLHHMYAVIPHQKHHLSPCEYDGVGLFASQLKRKTPAQHSNPDEGCSDAFWRQRGVDY